MKFNKYHKEVLRMTLDNFACNSDDSFLDVKDDPKLYKAFKELKNASITDETKPTTLNKKTVLKCLKILGS